MNMRSLRLELLGEFNGCLSRQRGGNFHHLVGSELGLLGFYIARGEKDKAEKRKSLIEKYVATLRASPEFRERELAYPIPPGCVVSDEYIEEAYQQFVVRRG